MIKNNLINLSIEFWILHFIYIFNVHRSLIASHRRILWKFIRSLRLNIHRLILQILSRKGLNEFLWENSELSKSTTDSLLRRSTNNSARLLWRAASCITCCSIAKTYARRTLDSLGTTNIPPPDTCALTAP